VESACYEYECEGRRVDMHYRPDTKDIGALTSTIDNQVARRSSVGFEVLPQENWLDLGAGIGAFGAYCHLMGATAECYEPDPDMYKLLYKNLGGVLAPCLYPSWEKADNKGKLVGVCPAFYTHETMVSTRKESKIPPEFTIRNQHPRCFHGRKFDGVKINIGGDEFELIESGWIPTCKKLIMEYHFTKDPSIAEFQRRIKKLQGIFCTVNYSATLDHEKIIKQGTFRHNTLIWCMHPKRKKRKHIQEDLLADKGPAYRLSHHPDDKILGRPKFRRKSTKGGKQTPGPTGKRKTPK